MGKMGDRHILIEMMRQRIGDHLTGNPVDVATVVAALRGGKTRREILTMDATIRCPNVWEFLDKNLRGGYVICGECKKAVPEESAVYFPTGEVFCVDCR